MSTDWQGWLRGLTMFLNYGVERILEHEQALTEMFIKGIESIPGIHIYRKNCKRVGTISLNVDGIDPSDLCGWLSEEDICVRRRHCAPLAHDSIGTHGTGAVRFSFEF